MRLYMIFFIFTMSRPGTKVSCAIGKRLWRTILNMAGNISRFKTTENTIRITILSAKISRYNVRLIFKYDLIHLKVCLKFLLKLTFYVKCHYTLLTTPHFSDILFFLAQRVKFFSMFTS